MQNDVHVHALLIFVNLHGYKHSVVCVIHSKFNISALSPPNTHIHTYTHTYTHMYTHAHTHSMKPEWLCRLTPLISKEPWKAYLVNTKSFCLCSNI